MRNYVTVAICIIACATLGIWFSQRGAADAAKAYPPMGWTIHVDAKKHFAGHPMEVAHHFCKNVAGGMIECQIYESDAPNARMVAVETIVPPAVYAKLPKAEQANWHYHKTEIPKVDATTPDMTKAEAAKLVAALNPTYGKVYVLWDPMTSNEPIGQPTITILK